MERNRVNGDRGPRRGAEREAAKPIDGSGGVPDDEETLQKAEDVPSFLTARELQARDPARGESSEDDGGDRHGAASYSGAKGEPHITDEEPPRGDRGLPGERSAKIRKQPK